MFEAKNKNSSLSKRFHKTSVIIIIGFAGSPSFLFLALSLSDAPMGSLVMLIRLKPFYSFIISICVTIPIKELNSYNCKAVNAISELHCSNCEITKAI